MEEAVVYNSDVVGLVNRMQRFIYEVSHSKSAGVSRFGNFDLARLRKYLAAVKSYQAFVLDEPQLDLPETHPRPYKCDVDPVVPPIESESVRDVVRLLEAARDELKGCQSARLPAGLIKFDSDRLTAITTKAERFLDNYVDDSSASPLDLPESSPNRGMPPLGRQGTSGL